MVGLKKLELKIGMGGGRESKRCSLQLFTKKSNRVLVFTKKGFYSWIKLFWFRNLIIFRTSKSRKRNKQFGRKNINNHSWITNVFKSQEYINFWKFIKIDVQLINLIVFCIMININDKKSSFKAKLFSWLH